MLLPRHQRVLLLAPAQQGVAVVEPFGGIDAVFQRIDLVAVDADTAALDEGAGLGFRFGQAGCRQGVDQAIRVARKCDAGQAILRQLRQVVFGEAGQITGEQAVGDPARRQQG